MKNDDRRVCKFCGNIIANPDNKTGICPRCSGKGKKIGGTILGGLAAIGFFLRKIIKK